MRMRMSSLLRPRCCPDHLGDGINDAMASYSPKRMEGKCREGGGWVGNKCAKIWQTRGRVEEKIIISKAVSQMRMTNFMVGGSMHSPLMFCSQPRRSCQPTASFSGAQTWNIKPSFLLHGYSCELFVFDKSLPRNYGKRRKEIETWRTKFMIRRWWRVVSVFLFFTECRCGSLINPFSNVYLVSVGYSS